MKKYIILIFLVIVLSLYIYIKIKNNLREEYEIKQKIYPLNIIADEIYWKSEKCFYYSTNFEIYEHCTDKLTKKILSLKNKYSNNIQRTITIGKSGICDTYNFEIYKPEDTATKVYYYKFEEINDPNIINFSLTLIVRECQEDLVLSSAFPFLEESFYRWDNNINDLVPTPYINKTVEIYTDKLKTSFTSPNNKLIEFVTVANFTNVYPNPNLTRYLLIDDNRELWILE